MEKGKIQIPYFRSLDRALTGEKKVFNMSGGEQMRDYLPVEKVAEYLVKIAMQKNMTGIINCCSGEPIQVKQFVRELFEIEK